MTSASDIRQGTFSGGEVCPAMFGRTDLVKYSSSLKKCRNIFIEQHGAALNRPGSIFVHEVKDSTKKVRLKGFIYSNDQAIVLEIGEGYIRFFQNGAMKVNPYVSAWSMGAPYNPGDLVTNGGSLFRAITYMSSSTLNPYTDPTNWEFINTGYVSGDPCEVATPYSEIDIFKLKFSQSGDVLTVTRTGYPVYELSRLTYTSDVWTFRTASIGVHYPSVHNLQMTAKPVSTPQRGFFIGNYYVSNPPTDGTQLIGWAVTEVDGDGRESLPFATSDMWQLLSHTAQAGSIATLTWTPGANARRYRIYQGVKGVWGLLDDIDADKGALYVVLGDQAPDFSQQPPQGGIPFSTAVTFPAHTSVLKGQRIVSNGNTYEAMNAGYTGASGPSTKGPGEKEVSYIQYWGTELTGAVSAGTKCYNHGNVYNCITSGTMATGSVSATTLPGPYGEGSNITDGTAHWEFVSVGERVLWKWIGIGTIHNYPQVVADFDQRRYYGVGQHLIVSRLGAYGDFDTNTVQTQPDDSFGFDLASPEYEEIRNLIPSRALLVLTSEAEWPVTGASGVNDAITPSSLYSRPHTFIGSSWLDALKIGNEALFVQGMGNLVIALTFNLITGSYSDNDLSIFATHLFENHTIKDWAYAKRPYGIVWAIRDDGILLGCTYNPRQEMLAWHRHDTEGTYESVCAIPEGNESSIYVVAYRTINGVNKRFIEKFASRILPRISEDEVDSKKGIFLDCAGVYSGAPTNQLYVPWLDGASVMALADGNVLGPYTIFSGTLNITEEVPDGASDIIVGLPYICELETLNLNVQGGENVRSNVKSVFRVSFEVVDSRQFSFGPNFDRLNEWKQREVKDSYGNVPAFTGLQHVRIASRYEHDARVVVRHTDPTPMMIVGLGRETDVGGD